MEPLKVESLDFHAKQNARECRTSEYGLVKGQSPTPVFRRGHVVTVSVKFDRSFVPKEDVVRFNFLLGRNANVAKGTKVVLAFHPNKKEIVPENQWGLVVQSQSNNVYDLNITIPYVAQIGIWKCQINSNLHGQREKQIQYEGNEDIYIIFNPWCKDDLVYMPNEQDRKEYVLNEFGKIWIGTFKEPRGQRWVFGQFTDVVLPSALFLLEKADLAHSDRGSPILIARAISAIINSNDDDGLLVGRWDGEYGDGTSPFAWTGSVAIFDEYLRNGGQPVKYGQCWVYSAATVTLCRALGIPCRSVTNYVSAHDTNRSLTVDKFFDVFGDVIENGPQGDCNDSCWNFHVWNDVWMERPDMPAGYGGWQIIDGTPQELSGNIFCCGPASVKAVRNGEVGYLYDTPFVFSEVNADVCNFQEDQDSEWGFSRMSINRYQVGRKILTKLPEKNDDQDDSDMWDVTSFYKNPEGSAAERQAVNNAVKGVPRAQEAYKIPPQTAEDVNFDLIDIDTVPLGKNFNVIVNATNKSNEVRTVTANLSATSFYYMGVAAHRIKKATGSFPIQPGKTEVLSIHVTPEEYLDKLVEHSLIKIYAIANVKETKQTWCEEDDFTLIKPKLRIEVKNGQVDHQCAVYFTFTNPLKVALTECIYSIEADGLQKPKTVKFRDVKPQETVSFREIFVPKESGKKVVVATFNSKELQGIGGSTIIDIN